ncbi:phage tail tape measure protein [Sphingobacterium spiritivorum]|uniref:phage tail tape measure protein n=1 Tax=Sphingobacterium spiritivorum TaxID=258 RepID=UPI003DA3474D
MASKSENRGVNIYLNANAADDTIKQLRNSARQLQNELAKLPRASEEFAEKSKALQEVKERLASLRREAEGVGESFGSLKDQLKDMAIGLTAAVSVQGVIEGIKKVISQNAILSDSYAGVMKTTGMTEVEVNSLNISLKKINTRTAKSELLELAKVAGKLGYSSRQDVEGFVRAADKVGVALGEDLGGTEEAVNSLGKLLDIFKLKDEFGIEDGLIRVGSAINDLGASGTANEANLVDFSNRLAGIAPAASISLQNVLGLGATMDELGQSMESSSTAIGQFIVGMGNDIPKFAKIAKMEVVEFTNLLKKDANEAFIRVLEGSKTAGGGLAALAANMAEMEVSGARGIAALGALAENTDLLRKRQSESNQSFAEGTSVVKEFDTANNTLAANLDKLGNFISNMWENGSFREWLTKVTAKMVDFRTGVEQVTDAYYNQKSSVDDLEANSERLVKRYDQLKDRGNLNKLEQAELHTVIQQLAELMPGAVTQFDKYGDALDINRQKVYEFMMAQKELVQYQNKDTIASLQAIYKNRIKEAEVWAENANGLNKAMQKRGVSEKGGLLQAMFGNDEKELTLYTQKSKDAIQEAKMALLQLQNFGIEWDAKQKAFMQKVSDPLDSKTPTTDTTPSNAPVVKAINNLESLRNKIKNLKLDLEKLEIGSPAFVKKAAEIKKFEDQLAKLEKSFSKSGNSGKTEEERAAERSQELFKKLVKDQELFAAQELANKQEKNDKEVEMERLKYDKHIDAWKEFLSKKEGRTPEQVNYAESQITKISGERDNAIDVLRINQEKETLESIEKLREGLNKKLETELGKERSLINAHYKKLLTDAGNNEVQRSIIEINWKKDIADASIREEKRLQDEIKKLRSETGTALLNEKDKEETLINNWYIEQVENLRSKFSVELQETKEFHEALELLWQEHQDRITANDKKNKDKEKKEEDDFKKTKREAAIQAAQDTSNALFSINKNNRDAELEMALSNLDKQRERELSNKSLSEAQKKAINDKYNKLEAAEKLKAWKAQKNADLLQAGINMALGITKALASSPPPVNFINAAAVGSASLAQMAAIATTKAPQFFHGGFTDERKPEGWVTRPTIFTSAGGNRFSAGENNMREYVISSEQLRDPRIADFVGMMESNRRNDISRIAPSPTIVQQVSDNSRLEGYVLQLIEETKKAQDKKVILSNSEFWDNQGKLVDIQNKVNS